jgi:hypothetical protein
MTKHQKLLALDAILVALEGEAPKDLIQLLNNVQGYLDLYFEESYGNSTFDKHLKDQLEAVKLLSKNPRVFGGG